MSVNNSTEVKSGGYWRRPKKTPKEMKGTPKLRNWAQLIKDRKAWNDLVQTTKNKVELWCKKKKRKKRRGKKKEEEK